jgi:hypothetical protein
MMEAPRHNPPRAKHTGTHRALPRSAAHSVRLCLCRLHVEQLDWQGRTNRHCTGTRCVNTCAPERCACAWTRGRARYGGFRRVAVGGRLCLTCGWVVRMCHLDRMQMSVCRHRHRLLHAFARLSLCLSSWVVLAALVELRGLANWNTWGNGGVSAAHAVIRSPCAVCSSLSASPAAHHSGECHSGSSRSHRTRHWHAPDSSTRLQRAAKLPATCEQERGEECASLRSCRLTTITAIR